MRLVGGIESCFVSLPLLLIQSLQSTSSGSLPAVLALELRSHGDDLWHVAWSGSASTSSAIEVVNKFAECISLPDHVTVKVRAVTNLPKASLVTVEPHSEDDWEILELNSEHAEAAILKQVGIVHEKMGFPLWLHGQTIITFLVISTIPENSVVQLVPGTKVAVAPKRRKRADKIASILKDNSTAKALLRVQDAEQRLVHTTEVNGVEMGVELTSLVSIHPETARYYSFNSLQLVVIYPKLPLNENPKNHESGMEEGSTSSLNEVNAETSADKRNTRHALVRLLFSESVAKGHVMFSHSMRVYLRAPLHSWVYVKRCNFNVKKDIPLLSVSPCRIRILGNNNSFGTKGPRVTDSRKPFKFRDYDTDTVDLSTNGTFTESLSYEPLNENEDANSQFCSRKDIEGVIRAWCLAQLDAVASDEGTDVNSLVMGNATLLQIKVKGNRNKKRNIDIMYLLKISEEDLHGGQVNAYEIYLNEEKKDLEGLQLLFDKLELGDPVNFLSVNERNSGRSVPRGMSSWMGGAASDITNRLTVLLSSDLGKMFSPYDVPLPGHILIYGPSGSGKTSMAITVAKSLERHEVFQAHILFVSCSELASEKAPTIRQEITSCISEAFDRTPSIVIFDDLDSIISSSSDSEGAQPSKSAMALTEFLTDIMDEYAQKRKSSCGVGPVAFIASVQSLEKLPQSLSSSGRFDFHVQLPAPTASKRVDILKHEIQKRSLNCSDDILSDVASKCDGYDAYDLEILVDRAVHAAVGRFLPSRSSLEEPKRPTLVRDDFSIAMHEFLPVAMRDINKSALEDGCSGWEDVGGLVDIRNAIEEMIQLPSKFPNIFSKAPLRLRSNVLLYGPPGCGKTHIVGAAAAAYSLRFISVKGPELLNKYIGASEQAVRDIFSKAAAAAPCLLFFDEFDSIAPKRGHDNTGVTDRIVNQFLTELDGVEVLTGVFVFAATSRPDLLDAALLRPGRLDRLLFCDFPSPSERLDILSRLSRKLPLAEDVDLSYIAYMTEGFSGADLQALLADAQLAAVHELLDNEDTDNPAEKPVISDELLKSVASRARPSVSEAEKLRLLGIYSQFLDSKRSVAAQSRDVKGKRATLA